MTWKAGPERPRTRFCWVCSRSFHGRAHARVRGADGQEHDVHKACADGLEVLRASGTQGNPRRPRRIQLRRTKGWRKPSDAVLVSRPSKWGNPFRPGAPDIDGITPMTPARAVERYRLLVLGNGLVVGATSQEAVRRELAGKDLACWCKPGTPCHADVLLEVANP